MGIVTFGPPPDLALALKAIFRLSTFVETGTYQGSTTLWAANHFESVITVEASAEMHEAAQPKFANAANIKSIYGDSPVVLQKILPTLPRSMFWLDAHWCGALTAGEESECPLLAELSIIMPWFARHVILIDDARLFLRPPPKPHKFLEWPSLDDILLATQASAQTYTCVYNDIIVVVPASHRSTIAELMQTLQSVE